MFQQQPVGCVGPSAILRAFGSRFFSILPVPKCAERTRGSASQRVQMAKASAGRCEAPKREELAAVSPSAQALPCGSRPLLPRFLPDSQPVETIRPFKKGPKAGPRKRFGPPEAQRQHLASLVAEVRRIRRAHRWQGGARPHWVCQHES